MGLKEVQAIAKGGKFGTNLIAKTRSSIAKFKILSKEGKEKAIARLEERIKDVSNVRYQAYNAYGKAKRAVSKYIPKSRKDIENRIPKNKKTIVKVGDEFITAIDDEVRDLWMNYLDDIYKKVGKKIEFKIGGKANNKLAYNDANGLFVPPNKKGDIPTIFLHDPYGAATFIEECMHAEQFIQKIPEVKDISYKGKLYKGINNHEFLVKTYLIDNAKKYGLTSEEVAKLELQLKDVLLGMY